MGSLILSKEHGVNPTLSICIICKKETGEIALLGASYKGEAPRHMVTSVIPCDECKKTYLKDGTLILSATEDRNGKPVPTGDLVVLTDSAYKRIFGKKPPKEKVTFLADKIFDELNSNSKKEE